MKISIIFTLIVASLFLISCQSTNEEIISFEELTGEAVTNPGIPDCTDSDGGLNYTIQGTAQFSWGGVSPDVCMPTSTQPQRLYEYYCVSRPAGNYIARRVYNCATTNGSTCQNGACVSATAPAPPLPSVGADLVIDPQQVKFNLSGVAYVYNGQVFAMGPSLSPTGLRIGLTCGIKNQGTGIATRTGFSLSTCRFIETTSNNLIINWWTPTSIGAGNTVTQSDTSYVSSYWTPTILNMLQQIYNGVVTQISVGYEIDPQLRYAETNEANNNGVLSNIEGTSTVNFVTTSCAPPNSGCSAGNTCIRVGPQYQCVPTAMLCNETDGGNAPNVPGLLQTVYNILSYPTMQPPMGGPVYTYTDTCNYTTGYLHEYVCTTYSGYPNITNLWCSATGQSCLNNTQGIGYCG